MDRSYWRLLTECVLLEEGMAGKGQFSFQSQRRTMSKNVQTVGQLCSFHMLIR